MQFFRCPTVVCGRPFQANRFDGRMAAPAQPGIIICPHCGTQMRGDTGYLFLTHALSAEQEFEFNSRYVQAPPVMQA